MKFEDIRSPDNENSSTRVSNNIHSSDSAIFEETVHFGNALVRGYEYLPNALKSFYSKSIPSPFKKEYIRQRLFRAFQALISLTPRIKSPLFKLFRRSAFHSKWFSDTALEHSNSLKCLKAPKNSAYKGKICKGNSLNEQAWRQFLSVSGVRELLAILNQFLFCGKQALQLSIEDVPTLSQNWDKDCCVENKEATHSEECLKKWRTLHDFVHTECGLGGTSIEWWMMLRSEFK